MWINCTPEEGEKAVDDLGLICLCEKCDADKFPVKGLPVEIAALSSCCSAPIIVVMAEWLEGYENS
jgi:hypothetical protein